MKNPATFYKMLVFGVLVFAAIVMASVAAFASAAAPADLYPVHLQQPLQSGTNFLFSLLSAAGGWAVAFMSAKYRFNTATQALASTTIVNGLSFAHQKALAAEQDIKDPSVKSQMVADAVNFFVESVPVGLGSLGLTPAKLVALATQKLPAVQAGVAAAANSATPAAPAPARQGASVQGTVGAGASGT